MFKKLTITTALMATGVITSLGYAAVAQTNQPVLEPNQTERPATQLNQNQPSSSDRMFMQQAARGGMAEVELSQLALQRSENRDVKQFAQQMIQDHTQANRRLMQLARQKDVNLSTELDAQHRVIRNRLSKLSGEEFDREYLNAMENDHIKTVELFQNQARQGENPDVTAFARNTLPDLRGHLRMVRAMISNPTGYNPGSHNQ